MVKADCLHWLQLMISLQGQQWASPLSSINLAAIAVLRCSLFLTPLTIFISHFPSNHFIHSPLIFAMTSVPYNPGWQLGQWCARWFPIDTVINSCNHKSLANISQFHIILEINQLSLTARFDRYDRSQYIITVLKILVSRTDWNDVSTVLQYQMIDSVVQW